jgi:hypothetical protein
VSVEDTLLELIESLWKHCGVNPEPTLSRHHLLVCQEGAADLSDCDRGLALLRQEKQANRADTSLREAIIFIQTEFFFLSSTEEKRLIPICQRILGWQCERAKRERDRERLTVRCLSNERKSSVGPSSSMG